MKKSLAASDMCWICGLARASCFERFEKCDASSFTPDRSALSTADTGGGSCAPPDTISQSVTPRAYQSTAMP